MQWQPAQGTQPLSPFDHQVAGQSSMLRYDKTTVCKPLIAREHFVYKSLPPDLAEFTPEYRGEIEVQLIEEDGYIQLYGLCVDDEADVFPGTPENHSHEIADMKSVKSKEISMKARSTVRLLRSGSYEVSASTNQVFYAADSKPDQPHTQSLNPWSLKNHKRLLDKMRKSEHSHDKIRFILLKNVVADFRHPCILDLKIGSRLHGDEASSVKVASQSEKCRMTTSSSLGVRLCGMQVYQVDANAYHSVDKYHGRTLNEVSFKKMLYDFLHNGTRFRSELIQPIVSRLSELIKCLEHLHSFRFYASSLLIIYDGDVGVAAGHQETKVQESKPGITAGHQETKVQESKPGITAGHQETKVQESEPGITGGDQETKVQESKSGITAGHQETKVQESKSGIIGGHQETKVQESKSGIAAGHQETKVQESKSGITAGHQETKVQESKSGITAGHQETKVQESKSGITAGHQEIKVQESKPGITAGHQETKVQGSKSGITAGHQETKVQESKSDITAGHQETKVQESKSGTTAGHQETKVQESKSGITADLAAADSSTGDVHSAKCLVQNALRDNLLPSKELCLQTSDTQKDHLGSEKTCKASDLNSSQKLCPSVATQQPAAEYAVSSKECSASAKTQTIDTSSDSSSVYQLVNCPSPCVNASEELHSVPDVFKCGVLLAELSALHSATTQDVEEDPSKTAIIHKLPDTPDQPLSLPKTDSIKEMTDRDKLSSSPENSQIGSSLLLQKNRNQQVPNLVLPNLRISLQDNVHCEQQTVQLDTYKQLLETDSAAEVSLPSISSVTPTETHAFPGCHTQSTNTIEKSLPVTGYGVPNDDLLQIPHVSVDFAFKEKSIPEVDQPTDHVSVCVPATDITSHVKPIPETCSVSKHMLKVAHSCGNNVKVDVKMIDFAHTTHQGFTQDKIKHVGPDTDYIFGLRNLLNLFQELLGFH